MKTKLGISAGFIGVLGFILALVAMTNYSVVIALLLIVGYVFLNEQNDWLKATVLKALVFVLAFYIADALLILIPTFLDAIGDILYVCGINFSIKTRISDFFYFFLNLLKVAYVIIVLLLAFMAPKFKTIKIGFIDKIVNKSILPKENAQQ